MFEARKRMFAALMLAAGLLPSYAIGQDFRVASEVFFGKEKKPGAENLTLFKGDVVYDFMLTEPNEVTIYDSQRSRIILLDPVRKVQTQLTLFQLNEIMKELQAKADQRLSPLIRPKLIQIYDDQSGWLTLASSEITYRAKGVRPSQTVAVSRLHEFTDWYARLNAARPGGYPPFARLELNKALAQRGMVALQVELTAGLNGTLLKKKFKVRSEHEFIWQLAQRDLQRIDRAGQYQAEFDRVSFSQYVNLDGENVAARPSGRSR